MIIKSTNGILMATLVLAICTGCSSDSADDNTALMAGLREHFDTDPVCVAFRDLPITTNDTWRIGNYRTLVKHGLLVEASAGQETDGSPRLRFDVGPDGSRYFLARGSEGDRQSVNRLCFGKREIIDIVETDIDPLPTEDTPYNMSDREARVVFRHRLVDVAEWANDPAVQSAFSAIKVQLDTAMPDTAREILTFANDAWSLDESLAFPMRDARQLGR